jgi:hypothetical protein
MIAINVFGPALRYRLDLLKHTAYEIRDQMVILTDRDSYTRFYGDFHSDYKFVFVEDYLNQYEVCRQYEKLPNVFKDAEDQFRNLNSYYKDTFFSFDIHRFILPYFIEQGIKKFFIVDSDMTLTNDPQLLKEFFDTLPEKSIFSAEMSTEIGTDYKREMYRNLESRLPLKDYRLPDEMPFFDGWARGFNFETVEDLQDFFELWNNTYIEVIKRNMTFHNNEIPQISSTEWLFSNLVQIFKDLKGYDVNGKVALQPGNILRKGNPDRVVGFHTPKVEDKLYHTPKKILDEDGIERYASRGAFYRYDKYIYFDYDEPHNKNISAFIKANREPLLKYYESWGLDVEMTDTHVYLRLK